MSKTKYFVRFLNRVSQYDADLELLDVFQRAVSDKALSREKDAYIFDYVDPTEHKLLSQRVVTSHNRMLLITHLRQTLFSAYLKDIYEDSMEYFNLLLAGAAKKGLDPNRLIGDHPVNLTANEILQCSDYAEVASKVSTSIFRKLENLRNTSKLLEAINIKLNLCVDTDLIKNSLPYFEIRHLLVHRDGIVDDVFVNNYPAFGLSSKKKVKLDNQLICDARDAIISLITNYDSCVVKLDIVHQSDIQG